jgi:uncharacterized protein (DUF1778 family)
MDRQRSYNGRVAASTRRKARGTRKDEEIRLRVTAAEKKAFTAAALRDGRDLSNWLRWVAACAVAAGKS